MNGNVCYESYPEYKDSGIEWLGEVPAHWSVVQLGRIGRFQKCSGGTKADEVLEGIPCVRYGDLYTSHRTFVEHTRSFITEDKVGEYTPLKYGDILFAGSGETIEEIGISAVNLIESQVRGGGDIILFRPQLPIDARFSGYLLDSSQSRFQKSCMGRGITVMHVYASELKYLWLSIPPLDEQAAIVRYLDQASDRISRAIRAKELLIELLTEQHQAVIHRAVTRGLDPNVRLKDSGVEWFGDMPEHWEVRRLGYLASKFGSGITPRGGASVYQESGIPFLRSQNIHFDGLRMNTVAHISVGLHQELIASHVNPGDVLLNITGASIGRVCSVPLDFEEANVNQHVCIIRPLREQILSEFLSAYLSTPGIQGEIYTQQSGASREGLTLQSIRSFVIPVPSVTEQSIIVRHLEKATADIDSAIDNAQRQIDLLREYRTRLIADVVTGQVDVRGAVEDEAELAVS